MEIKGIIQIGDNISMSCCDTVQDLHIDGVSLHGWLNNLFNQDVEEYFDVYDKQSPQYSMRYVILDEKPDNEDTFENLSANVIMEMLYCSHVSGCYSEWTCGYGGFDYISGEQGHSIFEELKSHIGKYLHLKI